MARDPLALLVHIGDAFTAMFRSAPGFEARMTSESWCASAGEAHCIWNWVALATASPTNQATLRTFVARCRERRVEGLACYPPETAPALAEAFRDLGLGEPGGVPLMVCNPADLPAATPSTVEVERLTDPSGLADAAAIVSASFEIPADQTTRVFTAGMLAEPAVVVYTARSAGSVTGVLAGTRFGDTVSIDIMAVDPAAQRRGIGRALMLAAMHDQVAVGAAGFHLLSSSEGQRLYGQIGFTTLLPCLTRFIPLDPIPSDQVVT